MSRASAAVSGAASASELDGTAGYLARSSRPLAALVILLPFILLYEIGTRTLLTDPVLGTQQVIAFTILQRFFAVLGATGRFLPALSVVTILLAWHLARKDRWVVQLTTLLGMTVESMVLGIPVIIAGLVVNRLFPLAAVGGNPAFADTFILSLGAGIYEELVFRLVLCTALAILLRNVLRLEPRLSMLLLVVLSATLFSAYHYLGNELFSWRVFAFRMVAGVYFAALFMARGFGVTAGAHMAYDIMIVML